jgi:hypothetical protein
MTVELVRASPSDKAVLRRLKEGPVQRFTI